ncbi:Replicase polyprotein 1ab [Trichinella spiralis]|uniref:Replicase polyprotein 1ab n=1 Tax=Trichinella spiralis TaxID=6334 RepID=A0ABR3L1U1_TRISP
MGGCSSGGKVILFTGLLSVRRFVNYIPALQNEQGNSERCSCSHQCVLYVASQTSFPCGPADYVETVV